ncbi:hypothetical protein ACFWZU_15580 [Frateuria sp. GZRR33]|uniref:hypothetical protein n=1 Tax=Frateuria sp. GZRR33 TaxID=3351535 RepID=UPI003EDBCC27
MSKALKTGDVKRYRTNPFVVGPIHSWAVVDGEGWVFGCIRRAHARDWRAYFKGEGHRIARVLSIGPKLVTVRIEK